MFRTIFFFEYLDEGPKIEQKRSNHWTDKKDQLASNARVK